VSAFTSLPTPRDWPRRVLLLGAFTVLLTLVVVFEGPVKRDATLPRSGEPAARPAPVSHAPQSALGRMAASLDSQIAAPWPALQIPNGRFRDILGGGTRYGEATLGYALLQAGARAHDRSQIHAAMKAISWSVRQSALRSRPSVFENLSLAAAYNLAKRSLRHDPLFKRRRARWEQFLETRQFKELNSTHNYDNHFVADAVATLELLRTGLHSLDPATVVGNPTAALAAVEQLINVQIPQLAATKAVTLGSYDTFVLSDPPDNPLSYHGLSLGLYARAVHLLGPAASEAARATLRRAAQASWWISAPDGDLGWYGRSDEESWGLAATAYGAAAAANLPDLPAGRAADFRALTERALTRLRAYGVGPRGVYITPAVARGFSHAKPGLDSSAGGPSFAGITLIMLNWALPELRGNVRSSGRIGADQQGGVQLSSPESRIAVVRHRDVWFALKLAPAPTRANDLRYDFGIHLLEVRSGDRWVHVLSARPQPGVAPSQARTPALALPGAIPPDSAGPVLLQPDGSMAVPYGDSATIGDDGTVLVSGGWRMASGTKVRSGVTFAFTPTANGVRMTIPRQPGDRIQYSVFLPGIAAPQPRRHSVSGPDVVASWRGRGPVHFLGGYASADWPHLVRANIIFSPGLDPVRLKLSAGSPQR
jgi:hypothetical protein